ncbi:MAG: signal peptidase II [Paenibacillaceae bacterium]|nr:signal peptidase II [Paenibacillaceae bacterium]
MIYYLIALIVIAIDQVTKRLVANSLEIGESHSVIGGFFEITSHRNRGAAFSILQEQRIFFIIITVIVVSGLLWYMRKTIGRRQALLSSALGLVLGGALGNFLDRARTGEVVDFLKFRFRFDWFGHPVDYTFAIFNVADAAISIGVALIFLDSIIVWAKEKKAAAAAAEPATVPAEHDTSGGRE